MKIVENWIESAKNWSKIIKNCKEMGKTLPKLWKKSLEIIVILVKKLTTYAQKVKKKDQKLQKEKIFK